MCRKRLLMEDYRKSLLCVALLACWGAPGLAQDAVAPRDPAAAALHIRPRYYRWYVNPGQEWVEKNLGYAFLDWKVPRGQAALVLVDVWDRHYIKDPEVRAEKIIQEKIRPLLAACRRGGLQVIHAPAPPQAKLQAGWVGRGENGGPAAEPAREGSPSGAGGVSPAREKAGGSSGTGTMPASAGLATLDANAPWPPLQFRRKTGPYREFARPDEPMEETRLKRLKGLSIHPDVRPLPGEPVIATGDELHRYCRQKGILFLFYVGFNTNACILLRDYGTIEMSNRGYEVILVRDCTTGMESFETADQLWQTRAAIQFLEMFGKYSITSDELIHELGVGAVQPPRQPSG